MPMNPHEIQSQLAQTQAQLETAQNLIRAIEGSNFWKLRSAWLKFKQMMRLRRFLPHNQVSQRTYAQWRSQNFPRPADLQKMAETIELFSAQPLVSIILPVFNPTEQDLRAAIASVIDQIYPHWQLCIADDASTQPYVQPILEEYAQHSQINILYRTENGQMAECANSALGLATGEFVALLNQDDLLTPDALYELVLLLNRHPEADFIYSDEDKVDASGELSEPYFKPDWCPDSLLSRMYIGDLSIYRRSLLNSVQGFRASYEGSQNYDLVLRVTEKTDRIFHIPKILYHRRIHAPLTPDLAANAVAAANRAIQEALIRRNQPGKVISSPAGQHIVRYQIKEFKPVTIIIPTKDLGDVLAKCLTSIFEQTDYPDYEVLLIDNGTTESKALAVIQQWKSQEPDRFRSEILDIPFNYSKINNYAAQLARGSYLLFLNNDTEVLNADWLTSLVEQAQRPAIGAVGALLLYPDHTIQHAGVVLGIGGAAGHSHKHFPADGDGYFSQIKTVNNYSSVTAACLMCRREVFEQVGGFTEDLAVSLNDVDLCLKMINAGYWNVYLPHVVLYHYESKSRGNDHLTMEKLARSIEEQAYLKHNWGKLMECDPCYSPNLTRKREDYSLNL
jgi:O-antigen biosynthesis protein